MARPTVRRSLRAQPRALDPEGRPIVTPETALEHREYLKSLRGLRRHENLGALSAALGAAGGRPQARPTADPQEEWKHIRRAKYAEIWADLGGTEQKSEEARMVWDRQSKAHDVNMVAQMVKMWGDGIKAEAQVTGAVVPAQIDADVAAYLTFAQAAQQTGWTVNANTNNEAIKQAMVGINNAGIFHRVSTKGQAATPGGWSATENSDIYWDARGDVGLGTLTRQVDEQLNALHNPLDKAIFLDEIHKTYGVPLMAMADIDQNAAGVTPQDRDLAKHAIDARKAMNEAMAAEDAALASMDKHFTGMQKTAGVSGNQELENYIFQLTGRIMEPAPRYHTFGANQPPPDPVESNLQERKRWIELNSFGDLTTIDGETVINTEGNVVADYGSYAAGFGSIRETPAEEMRDNIRGWLEEMERGETRSARAAKHRYMTEDPFFQAYHKSRPYLTKDQAFSALNKETLAVRNMNRDMGIGIHDAALRSGVADATVGDVRTSFLKQLLTAPPDSKGLGRFKPRGAKGVPEPEAKAGAELTKGARGPGDPVGGEAIPESDAQAEQDAQSMMLAQLGVGEPEGRTRGGRRGAVERELQELVDSGQMSETQRDAYMEASGLTEDLGPKLNLTAAAENFPPEMTGKERAAQMIMYMSGANIPPGTLLKDDEDTIAWIGEPPEGAGGQYIYEGIKDKDGEIKEVHILYSPESGGGQVIRPEDTSKRHRDAWAGFMEEIDIYSPDWAREREEQATALTGQRAAELEAAGEDVHARLPSKEPVPSERGKWDKERYEYGAEPGYDVGMLGPDPDVERPGQVMRAGPEHMTEAAGRRPETKVGRNIFEAQAEWMFDEEMFEAIPAFKGLSEEEAIKKFADAAVRNGSNPSKVLDGIERRWFDLNDPQKTISAREYGETFRDLFEVSDPKYALSVEDIAAGDPQKQGHQIWPGEAAHSERLLQRRYRAMVKPEGPLEIEGADPDVLRELRAEKIGGAGGEYISEDLALDEPPEELRRYARDPSGEIEELSIFEAQQKLSGERIAVLEQMANREPPYEDISPERAALSRQTVDQYKRAAQLDPEQVSGTPREQAELDAVRRAILGPAEQAEQTLWELPEKQEETWGPFGKLQKGAGRERRGLMGTGRRAWQAEAERTGGLDVWPSDPQPSAPVGAPGSGRGYWETTPRTPELQQTGEPLRPAASPATETLRTGRREDRRKGRQTRRAARKEAAATEI